MNIFFVRLKLYMRTLPMFISNFNFIIGKTRCGVFIMSKWFFCSVVS
ncbi:MAG TPA: hypothetical protein VIF37_09180 [Methylobacter sp.]